MPRKTIPISTAAAAVNAPVVSISDATITSFISKSSSVWEALYAWLADSGHAEGVKPYDIHNVTRVGADTMKKLIAAQRKRMRSTVRFAKIDGAVKRVHPADPRGRVPTAEELDEMVAWSNGGSGPMESDPAGRRLVGEGLYIESNRTR